MPDVRITKEETLSQEEYTLKQYSFERKNKEGEWAPQKRQVFDHGNAATALLYNKEKGTVILTRQFRLPPYLDGQSGFLTETPAGKLDEGETPEDAVLREIKEETGYAVTGLQKLFDAYSSPAAVAELLHFYAAPYTPEQKTEKGGGKKEEGEELEVLEMPFAEAMARVEKGEIKDIKTIVLLQYARLKNLV